MSRNIKEIGKELMGKSLNSFHRKTGLTQLEKNNEMQDGILDGILSQVDDAYIEKTEQSNVIHLDGSGDGVVVLDSIEGNTMVNLSNKRNVIDTSRTKTVTMTTDFDMSKKYTFIFELDKDITDYMFICMGSWSGVGVTTLVNPKKGRHMVVLTPTHYDSSSDFKKQIGIWCKLSASEGVHDYILSNTIILEGDHSDKNINYFEGLQSSFEEKVNSEGKHEIEILSNNKNLFNNEIEVGTINADNGIDTAYSPRARTIGCINVYENTQYTIKLFNSYHINRIFYYDIQGNYIGNLVVDSNQSTFTTPKNTRKLRIVFKNTTEINITQSDIDILKSSTQLEKGGIVTSYTPNKQNKIKLLINEPLRSLPNGVKDKLCVKDNSLIIERNCYSTTYTGNESWAKGTTSGECTHFNIVDPVNVLVAGRGQDTICDKLQTRADFLPDVELFTVSGTKRPIIKLKNTRLSEVSVNGLKQWLSNNNVTVVIPRCEPFYEEVLNEYGEPILLEGYENGTVYIDSTIVPTTTVRYTPKMESFKTLKEVENNNIILTNDVNDNIIPYMMDVDLMIMEKEMALMSHKNIRKMEVLDMTSMQKRTQEMLERLIKGKTLTEQECNTRVTTYLHAGKITDEQAEELMLLISEVYA